MAKDQTGVKVLDALQAPFKELFKETQPQRDPSAVIKNRLAFHMPPNSILTR